MHNTPPCVRISHVLNPRNDLGKELVFITQWE